MSGKSTSALGRALLTANAYIAEQERLVRQWGDWKLDAGNLTVTYDDGESHYEIDLERCRTSAEVLDWIFQVDAKIWANSGVTADLVRALRDILNPQVTLCSFGKNKTLNVSKWIKRRYLLEGEQNGLTEGRKKA